MAFTPFSAKNARVLYLSYTFVAKKWDVEIDGGEIDTSSFESLGYTDRISALLDAKITVAFDMDASFDMFNSPKTMQPGQVSGPIKLYFNVVASSTVFWLFTSVLIMPLTNSSAPRDSGNGTIKFGNKGAFAFPVGTFSYP